jgi:hypothetical protein
LRWRERYFLGKIDELGGKVMKTLVALKVACTLVICGLSMGAFAAETSATRPEQGVWQKHEYSFQFLGFTTTYSCEGLAGKLRVLLIAVGARADAKSISGACSRGYGTPDKFSQASLTFYALAPLAPGENASPAVGGEWRSVALAARSPRELALGDCELVEQFRDKVLPMFTTRNLENRMTCVPNQLSGSTINLKFDVFAGVPPAKKKSLEAVK